MQSRAKSASIPLIQMRPSNERELAIARTVDKFANEGRLDPTAMDGIVADLGFPAIHPSDRRYLERSVEWRMLTPSSKPLDMLTTSY